MTKGVYYRVAVEAIERVGGGSNAKYRVHPLPGQGYDISMNVECGRAARKDATGGNVIVIWAEETNREDGTPFLYSYHGWAYDILPKSEAEKLIKAGRLGHGRKYNARIKTDC